MRIIHTPPRYAPHIGGVEAVDKVLAEYAAEQGHQVWVLAADEPRRGPSEVNGIRVQRLSWHLKLANTNLTPGLPRALWSAQWDVVHTHLPTPWTADVSVLVAKVLRRRSVVHFHNPIVGDGLAGLVAWVYRKTLQRMTLRLTDAIIVISATRQELLISGQPSIAAKVHLVPNGVDLERFAPVPFSARSTADVLFVSVLDDFHDYKGLSVLLQAAAYVPGATLRIVGDGPGRGRWEREAVALGIADRVHFEGAVSNADLLGLYRSCAVFALPSQTADHEGGSSLVALEAMASGLPVVLADGVGDLAAQAQAAGGGIAVRSGDAKGLAVALSTLLGSATTRSQLESPRGHTLNVITPGMPLARRSPRTIYGQIYRARSGLEANVFRRVIGTMFVRLDQAATEHPDAGVDLLLVPCGRQREVGLHVVLRRRVLGDLVLGLVAVEDAHLRVTWLGLAAAG